MSGVQRAEETTHSPDTVGEAVEVAFARAVERAVSHPEIETQALGLDPRRTPEERKKHLREVESELLAAVAGPLALLNNLYRIRTRLDFRARAQGEHGPRLRSDEGSAVRKSRQRLEDSSEWRDLAMVIDEAVGSLASALIDQAMVPHLRSWLNDEREKQEQENWRYGRRLDDEVDISELRDPVTGQRFEETQRLAELGRLLARMPGGSVGIAGPRGSGKSTAIEHVEQILASQKKHSTPYRLFRVSVSAPVEYVPREFLMHLHEQICKAWLKRDGTLPGLAPMEGATQKYRGIWTLATTVLPLALAVVGVWLVGSFAVTAPIEDYEAAIPLAVTILAATAAAVFGAVRAIAIRYQREYTLVARGLDRHSSLVRTSAEQSEYRSAWALGTSVVVAVLASVLVVVYAAGLFEWLDLRRLGGVLLLASAIWGVAMWRATNAGLLAVRSLPRAIAGNTMLAACMSAGLNGVGLVFLSSTTYSPTAALVAGGAVVSAASCLGAMRGASPHDMNPDDQAEDTAVALATRDLRRLRFQRTQAAGRTAAVKVSPVAAIPMVFEAGETASTSDVEVAMSTPTVTAMIIDLLTQIRKENPDEIFKIVVGIDELDKLEGEEGARIFLNEIKGVFTVPGVLFLVSVSEEAMASFERRGLAFRDVFDSAFDEIIHVPQLTLDETRKMLGRRIDNLPRPFVALAHCLSAGLARDVIRAIDHMTDTTGTQDIKRVTEAVVHREIRGKWQALVAAIRPIPLEPQVTDMLKALYPIDLCPGSESVALQCLVRAEAFDLVYTDVNLTIPSESELAQFRTLQRLGGEYLGFTYFCRTLIEFFDLELPGRRAKFIEAERADRLERASIDFLARARQHLGVNPRLAWEQVSSFRGAHNMAPVSFPETMLGSSYGPGVSRARIEG